MKGDGGRPKVRKPWIPPGRLSCRRDVDSHKCQVSYYCSSLLNVLGSVERKDFLVAACFFSKTDVPKVAKRLRPEPILSFHADLQINKGS